MWRASKWPKQRSNVENGERGLGRDHLYSVAALTNQAGGVVERYRYSTFGERTVLAADGVTTRTASSYNQQVGFTGRFEDKESKLLYFRARYYSGRLGRFVGRDPWMADQKRPSAMNGYQTDMSLYEADFVPNYTDPTGMVTHTECVEAGKRAKTSAKDIIDAIKAKGCKEPEIECLCCGTDKSKGNFFDVNKTKNVIMCEDSWTDTGTLESAIRHELVHAYDDCMGTKWSDCEERACSEVRAYSHSGNCDDNSPWRGTMTRDECVKHWATLSTEADPKCKPGRPIVDKVFAKCNVPKSGGGLPPWPFATAPAPGGATPAPKICGQGGCK